MKLLRDCIEPGSAFKFRKTMRNWYMCMAPWDRPRECEVWLPDFLGDKKFFDEDETISMGFHFPGPQAATAKKRSAPTTITQPAPTKKTKLTPSCSTLPIADSTSDNTQSQAVAGPSSSTAPPQAVAPVQSSKSSTAPNTSTSSKKQKAVCEVVSR